MPDEIERKFLLRSDAWRADVHRREAMSQGYLAGSGHVSVRVRVAGDRAWLNIKAGGIVPARKEYEYAVPVEEGRELLGLAPGPLIEKTRHWVEHGGFTWEIDEFEGVNRGLVVAEIELAHLEQSFPHPAWLGMEVTALHRYYNVKLVDRPFCEWTDQERDPTG
jgi:adenylate cyclase